MQNIFGGKDDHHKVSFLKRLLRIRMRMPIQLRMLRSADACRSRLCPAT